MEAPVGLATAVMVASGPPLFEGQVQQQQQQQQRRAAARDAEAAALHVAQRLREHQQAQQQAEEDGGLHRRLLRFVLGGLLRRGRQQQQQQQQADPAVRPDARAALGPSPSLCGCSDDLATEDASEDVLGMSPFASVADLQDYRMLLQERRRKRELDAGAAATPRQRRRRQALAEAAPAGERQWGPGERAPAGGPLRRALAWLARALRGVARHVSPQGEGLNDATLGERVFNVLTSVPFVLVGIHSLRSGGVSRRRFGASFVATGVIAAAYHSSSGGVRKVLRKLDYYSIALTSGVLRAAAGANVHPLANAAAALVTPLKPTLVVGLNLAAIEARYLAAALQHVHLRPAFGAHLGAGSIGMGCFFLEDLLVIGMGAPPVFHSLWHVLSAAALGLIGPLLSHCDGGALVRGAVTAAGAL